MEVIDLANWQALEVTKPHSVHLDEVLALFDEVSPSLLQPYRILADMHNQEAKPKIRLL
jgi:hypothetical protein